MLSERQRRVLQVLRENPAGLVADELLRRTMPDVTRDAALETLRRLVNAGLVSVDKWRAKQIAGCLVRLAVPDAAVSLDAIGRKFVADPRAVSH